MPLSLAVSAIEFGFFVVTDESGFPDEDFNDFLSNMTYEARVTWSSGAIHSGDIVTYEALVHIRVSTFSGPVRKLGLDWIQNQLLLAFQRAGFQARIPQG